MSNSPSSIECLFVDIGGVLLSDGWGHAFRKQTAITFNLDYQQMEARHREAFEAYEIDKLSLQQYLALVIFYEDRVFSETEFRAWMFGLSFPYPQMIELVQDLKKSYGLKVIVLSNEAREMNAHRISRFGLRGFVDIFLSSSFLQLRKPDPEFYRIALDIVQIPPERILYLENTPMFIEVAKTFGINSILHRDFSTTCENLSLFGLKSRLPA